MSLAFYQKLYATKHDNVVPLDIFWTILPYILLILNFCHEHMLRRIVVDTHTAKGVGVGVGGGCVCVGGGEGEALKGGHIGEKCRA